MLHRSRDLWGVYREDGSLLDTGDSQTEGLQEALDYAVPRGFMLHVIGGGVSYKGPTDYNRIECSVPITVSHTTGNVIILDGVTLLFGTGVTGDGLVFDSADFSNFIHRGQIVYRGNGSAVRFNPVTPNTENFIGITSSTFEFGAVAVVDNVTLQPVTNKGLGLRFSPASGLIINNTFRVAEFNGGLVGCQVDSSAQTFQQNRIVIPSCHTQGSTGITVGHTATANIFKNTWNVHVNGNGGSAGISVWGQKDLFIGQLGYGSSMGLLRNATSSKNKFLFGSNDYATPMFDASTAHDDVIL